MSKAEDPSVQGGEYEPQPARYADDEDLILPPAPKRSKTPSRCYNASFIVVYFVLLIMAVVALGSFGAKQADINARLRKSLYFSTAQSCILFTEYREVDGISGVQFHANGPCGYVFYGLVSITIVAFLWLVGSIVQTAIGLKIISMLRILDLVVMGLMFLLSLSLSATITIGLDTTCNAFFKSNPGHTDCRATGIVFLDGTVLYYYDSINIAKSSSWAATVFLLAISVWYIIMCIAYCYTVKRRREQTAAYQDEGNIRSVLGHDS